MGVRCFRSLTSFRFVSFRDDRACICVNVKVAWLNPAVNETGPCSSCLEFQGERRRQGARAGGSLDPVRYPGPFPAYETVRSATKSNLYLWLPVLVEVFGQLSGRGMPCVCTIVGFLGWVRFGACVGRWLV